MMRVLTLGGAGAVCQHAIRDLGPVSPTSTRFVIGDYNVGRRREIGGRDWRCPRQSGFATICEMNGGCLIETFSGFDVVLNGLPWKYDLVVTRACVAAGVNGLDVSTEPDQWGYDMAAREKAIVFIPGVGATPGITNVMARRGAEQMDEVEDIQINFAAFRCPAPAPGLLTTFLWEFHPETHERVYYRDGAFHEVGPFAGARRVVFPVRSVSRRSITFRIRKHVPCRTAWERRRCQSTGAFPRMPCASPGPCSSPGCTARSGSSSTAWRRPPTRRCASCCRPCRKASRPRLMGLWAARRGPRKARRL